MKNLFRKDDVATVGHGRNAGPVNDGILPTLQQNILKTLLYFDIFNHPLTLAEVYRFLPSNSITPQDVKGACLSETLSDTIAAKAGYYYLKSREDAIVLSRLQKERRARRMLIAARIMAGLVGAMPFVRAVFISGELSKGVAGSDGDIDFFIVTAPQRVWIVRTCCAAFKKLFLFNSKKLFCYNHIVSETRLEVEEQNTYTAIELVTLMPLKNEAMWHRLQRSNSWTRNFLPNARHAHQESNGAPPAIPVIERILTALVSREGLDRLDHWLLDRWRRAWERRYPDLAPEKRLRLFRSGKDISTAYGNDFSERILTSYYNRLQEYHLMQPRDHWTVK